MGSHTCKFQIEVDKGGATCRLDSAIDVKSTQHIGPELGKSGWRKHSGSTNSLDGTECPLRCDRRPPATGAGPALVCDTSNRTGGQGLEQETINWKSWTRCMGLGGPETEEAKTGRTVEERWARLVGEGAGGRSCGGRMGRGDRYREEWKG